MMPPLERVTGHLLLLLGRAQAVIGVYPLAQLIGEEGRYGLNPILFSVMVKHRPCGQQFEVI